jgi:hypothetical protein
MSFSYNIFTNLPLVHTQNPDFLGQQLWLCFFVGSWMSSRVTPELGPRQIPESAFASLQFVNVFSRDSRTGSPTDSRISRSSKFAPSPARGSGLLHVRDSTSSPNHDPRTSYIREFEVSQVLGLRKSWVPCPWKTSLKNFVKPNVSRVTGFPEFPNTCYQHATGSSSFFTSSYIYGNTPNIET